MLVRSVCIGEAPRYRGYLIENSFDTYRDGNRRKGSSIVTFSEVHSLNFDLLFDELPKSVANKQFGLTFDLIDRSNAMKVNLPMSFIINSPSSSIKVTSALELTSSEQSLDLTLDNLTIPEQKPMKISLSNKFDSTSKKFFTTVFFKCSKCESSNPIVFHIESTILSKEKLVESFVDLSYSPNANWSAGLTIARSSYYCEIFLKEVTQGIVINTGYSFESLSKNEIWFRFNTSKTGNMKNYALRLNYNPGRMILLYGSAPYFSNPNKSRIFKKRQI